MLGSSLFRSRSARALVARRRHERLTEPLRGLAMERQHPEELDDVTALHAHLTRRDLAARATDDEQHTRAVCDAGANPVGATRERFDRDRWISRIRASLVRLAPEALRQLHPFEADHHGVFFHASSP